MSNMLSFHLLSDDDNVIFLDVVLNGETSTPIGKVVIYDLNCSDFIPYNTESIDLRVLYKISKIFGFIEQG